MLSGMIKKKITITLKKKIKKRGRPPKTSKKPASNVYSLISKVTASKQNTVEPIIKNNDVVVRLALGIKLVAKLERDIRENKDTLLYSESFNQTPVASNETINTSKSKKAEAKASTKISVSNDNGINKIIKGKKAPKSNIARRDLLINSGVTKKVSVLMKSQQCGNEWPCHSPYDCWYDGHPFTCAPVGIPEKIVDNKWYLYGNFCSYNCALRYLCPHDEDDRSRLMVSIDITEYDERSERRQLLELLCHIETDKDVLEPLKKAPSRLSLKNNGGDLDVDEFRENFYQHKEYQVFKTPMIPIDYRIEETIRKNQKKRTRKSLNMTKKEKIQIELNFQKKNKTRISNNTIINMLH